jgi:hypothetical protein
MLNICNVKHGLFDQAFEVVKHHFTTYLYKKKKLSC